MFVLLICVSRSFISLEIKTIEMIASEDGRLSGNRTKLSDFTHQCLQTHKNNIGKRVKIPVKKER